MFELTHVPERLEDKIVEENVCKVVSLTGVDVTLEELQ